MTAFPHTSTISALSDHCDQCCPRYSPTHVPLHQEMWAGFLNNNSSGGNSSLTVLSPRGLVYGKAAERQRPVEASGGRVLFHGGCFANRHTSYIAEQLESCFPQDSPTALPIAHRPPPRLLCGSSNILSKCHVADSPAIAEVFLCCLSSQGTNPQQESGRLCL